MGRPKKEPGTKAVRTNVSLPAEVVSSLWEIAAERYAAGQRDGISGVIRELLVPALARRARTRQRLEVQA